MTEKATQKENIMLRLDIETATTYRKVALEMSTPQRRVTGQDLMRAILLKNKHQLKELKTLP